MKKRGISPILSTVLLIGFVIALGAMVSTYLIKQAQDFDPEALIEDSVLCDNVAITPVVAKDENEELKIVRISGGKTEGVAFKNKGTFSIHKLTITTAKEGSQDYAFFEGGQNNPLKPGEEREINIFLEYTAGQTTNIKVTPWIQDKETEGEPLIICTKKEIIFDFNKLIPEE